MGKQYCPGLDVLKFILSILVVGIHTQLFSDEPFLCDAIKLLNHCAVPTFFAMSSYLYYHNIKDIKDVIGRRDCIIHYLKRLLLLLFSWEVLLFPFKKIAFWEIASWKEILFVALFSGGFSGFWFLKALFWGMLIFSIVPDKNKPYFTLIACFCFVFMNLFRSSVNAFLGFEPYFTFILHLGSIGIGYICFLYEDTLLFRKTRRFYLCAFLILYCYSFIEKEYSDPIYRLLVPFSLIPLFSRIPISKSVFMSCVVLRKMSIMIFMSHFVFIFILGDKFELFDSYILNSLLYHFTILFCSIFFSWVILQIEKKFHIARYLY